MADDILAAAQKTIDAAVNQAQPASDTSDAAPPLANAPPATASQLPPEPVPEPAVQEAKPVEEKSPEPLPTPSPLPSVPPPPKEASAALVESILEPQNPSVVVAPPKSPPKPFPKKQSPLAPIVGIIIVLILGASAWFGAQSLSQRNSVTTTISNASGSGRCEQKSYAGICANYDCTEHLSQSGCSTSCCKWVSVISNSPIPTRLPIPTAPPPSPTLSGCGSATNKCPLGATCTPGTTFCNTGLYCSPSTRTCQPSATPGGYGAPCDAGHPCANGYTCSSTTTGGTCQPNVTTADCGRNLDTGAPVCCSFGTSNSSCTANGGEVVCEARRLECRTGGTWCTLNATGCGGGGSNPPTRPPTTPVCQNIKIYKGGVQVTPSTLVAGDEVVLAIKGNLAPDKAHFRVNGGDWQETTTKNSNSEFTLPFTVPSGVTDFVIEGEVFTNGNWN